MTALSTKIRSHLLYRNPLKIGPFRFDDIVWFWTLPPNFVKMCKEKLLWRNLKKLLIKHRWKIPTTRCTLLPLWSLGVVILFGMMWAFWQTTFPGLFYHFNALFSRYVLAKIEGTTTMHSIFHIWKRFSIASPSQNPSREPRCQHPIFLSRRPLRHESVGRFYDCPSGSLSRYWSWKPSLNRWRFGSRVKGYIVCQIVHPGSG